MSPSVLLVEDSDDIRMLVGLLLSREGLDVEAVSSGESAIRSVVRRIPDVVVTDVGLPDINGWQVMASVRALSDVPILMLTGESGPANEAKGMRAGADAFINKPFDNAELVAAVLGLVKRGPASEERHDNG